MSRTSLDDAQYAARFERLNGAIRDLAFGIRREWTTIPEWLMPFCNQDAHRVGQKEMIAVGRAYISRCIYDNIFYAHFHPGLDMALSGALKKIERNIRRTTPTSYMPEAHRDDITAKLPNGRLVTLEGLQDDMINASERMSQFISFVSSRIVDSIIPMITHPAPTPLQATLESGVQMIVELAVGIASNLPIESRDVHIEYFMPGTPIDERFMRMETGIGPLLQPGRGRDDDDGEDDGESGPETEEKDAQSIAPWSPKAVRNQAVFSAVYWVARRRHTPLAVQAVVSEETLEARSRWKAMKARSALPCFSPWTYGVKVGERGVWDRMSFTKRRVLDTIRSRQS